MKRWLLGCGLSLCTLIIHANEYANEAYDTDVFFEQYPEVNIQEETVLTALNTALNINVLDYHASIDNNSLFPHINTSLIHHSSALSYKIVPGLVTPLVFVDTEKNSQQFIRKHRQFLEKHNAVVFVVAATTQKAFETLILQANLDFQLGNGDALHESLGVTQYPVILIGEPR